MGILDDDAEPARTGRSEFCEGIGGAAAIPPYSFFNFIDPKSVPTGIDRRARLEYR